VMRPVCMMGQAAGTAAAIAIRHAATPRGVYENHIKQLQQALLKDGCFLPGVRHTDSNDLALRAEVTASSFINKMKPQRVNNGWNRSVGADRNAWAPDPNASLPHWIQLKLKDTSVINSVHVSFEDSENLAVDLNVEASVAGSWKKVAEIAGNQSRRRTINFKPVKTDTVRLILTKASTSFAICEVRLYNEPANGIKKSTRCDNGRKH
jgi:hypothetical protein